MRSAILWFVRKLAVVGFALLFSAGASADTYYSDGAFQISGSGSRSSRECTVTFQPSQTLGGTDAPRLTLLTIGQDRLTLDIGNRERYQDAVIVQNNKRNPFVAVFRQPQTQFSDSDIAKTVKSGKLFFITAKQIGTGNFVSSRYESIDFDAILRQIEVNCPFDAESMMSNLSDRRRAEDDLKLSLSDMTLIRWVLRKKYHGENDKPGYSQATLSQDDRNDLKRYAAENDSPISTYLTAPLARQLLAEGKVLESTQPPPPPPPPVEPEPPPPEPVVSEYFTLRACNNSRVTIAMAISARVAPDDSRFKVIGWYTVPKGKCEDFGPYPKGWFYIYGEQKNSGRLVWSGNDIKLCVKYPGPFERIGETTCNYKRLKGFSSVFIESSTETFTWNFNR